MDHRELFETLCIPEPDFHLIVDLAQHAVQSAVEAIVATLDRMPSTFDKILAMHVVIPLLEERMERITALSASKGPAGQMLIKVANDIRAMMKEDPFKFDAEQFRAAQASKKGE
jgi:hypothetical protein